jgi:hypothetical protein
MTQLSVYPTIDSTMDYGSPDTNFGQSSTIGQGVTIAGGQKSAVRRAIVNFDVSAVPVSAVITHARLVRNIATADASQHSVRIARCTRPTQWTESGVTWNKYDGVSNWITGGGEHDDITPAAVSFVEATGPGPHEVSGLGGFVRDALDLRNGIVSLIFRNDNEAPQVSQRSSWGAGALWYLVIDYNVTSEPVRRSLDPQASGRRPAAPRAPSGGSRPSEPSQPNPGRRNP